MSPASVSKFDSGADPRSAAASQAASGARAIITLVLAAAGLLPAQQPDYFPLHVGNQWIYRTTSPLPLSPLVVSISRAETFGGRQYVLVENFAGLRDQRLHVWLRQDDQSRLYEYNPETGAERLRYDFQAREGETFSDCARLNSRNESLRSPIGDLSRLLAIVYPCTFQVGPVRELFLPYIGMVQRQENIGGPLTATRDLIYARIGGVTQVEQPSLTFGLALDRSTYFSNRMPPVDPALAVPVLFARLSLRNTHSEPLIITFPTSQIYDFVVREAQTGTVLYRWSDGRGFTDAIERRSFAGETNWGLAVPLGNPATAQPFPQGDYLAEASLSTSGPQPAYRAIVGFSLRHVF